MMRSSVLLSTLMGSLVAAQSTTISVWDLEIVRRFDQTMVGEVLTMDDTTTVLAYSCPDEIGCGTGTVAVGPSTYDATLTTEATEGATQTEIIHCDVTETATIAKCTQSYITVTNGATATDLVTTDVQDEWVKMGIVVPATSAPSTPTATPKPTNPYTTASVPTSCTTPAGSTSGVPPVYTSETGGETTLTPAPSDTTTSASTGEPPVYTSETGSFSTTTSSGSTPTYGGSNGTIPAGGSPTGGSSPTGAPENAASNKAVGALAAVGAAFGAAVFAL